MNRKLSTAAAVRAVALLTAVLLTVVAGLASGGAATAATSAKHTTVAHTSHGTMTSKVVGSTKSGRRVTGSFTPLTVVQKNGKEKVRGLLHGVVHKADGSTTSFSTMRTMKIASIGGTPLTKAGRSVQGLATCDVLNLVLAPLDLNLLGLQIHLDKVVLNIVAVSGAGNLLGNLLCSVTHLLDGGLGGLLGQLTDLLNQILAALGLGL